jgi:hypothetical protein
VLLLIGRQALQACRQCRQRRLSQRCSLGAMTGVEGGSTDCQKQRRSPSVQQAGATGEKPCSC